MTRKKFHLLHLMRRTYSELPAWKKAIVVIGGVLFSPAALFILAVTLLSLLPVSLIEGWEGDTGHAGA